MTKYLVSTLTAAAAMAVPAFSAELIAGWDFTSIESITDGTIAATTGTLVISTGSSLSNNTNAGGNVLNITSSTGGTSEENAAHKTTIDVSGASLTTDEGISIVMTIYGWSSSGNCIFASIDTDNTDSTGGTYSAAIGETGSGATRSGWFAADGSSDKVTTTQYEGLTYDWTNGTTIAMTFIGDTLSLYELDSNGSYVLVASAVMKNDSTDIYSLVTGNIDEIAIGSWDGTSTDGEFGSLQVSSLYIYSGNIMAAPEPSMFSMMFGLGAIGLVATRRRRRA